MKTLFVIFCGLVISTSAFGQFDFRSSPDLSKKVHFIADSLQQDSGWNMKPLLDSIFHLEENYDFQFRFWESSMMFPSTSVFLLTLRNNKWSARFFQPDHRWQVNGKLVSEVAVDQTKLDQLWELLVMQNVLTLPPQSLLRGKMVKYEIDTTNLGYGGWNRKHLDMVDGAGYYFQLVNANSSRNYSYQCPQTFLGHFSNIEELYNASLIILLIKKYLGIHHKGC